MVLGLSPAAALAEDVDLTPGPTIIQDPASPTGYTGHFVYHNPTATSVRFVADILLRDWENPTSPTIYQPSQYRPGLMRGGGGYDVQMTNVGDGYWVTDVPLAAGANQYWFYVNNNTNLWVTDPANPPIYAPDGLTGTARRAFNKVNVPYDEKQNFAPLAARVIENVRPYAPTGTGSAGGGSWGYVPFMTTSSAATTLVAPSAVGDTKLFLASVAGLAVGGNLSVDTAANQETGSISAVGTAAGGVTTLFSAANSGDTNVKVPSVAGFVVGQQILIDTAANLESRTITTVGTAGRATTLAAAAAAGATNIKVGSVTGLVVGDTLTIDTGANLETATIAIVGTQGPGGTGVTVTAPLTLAHATAAAVRDQSQPGTGITFSAGLNAGHAIGTTTRGSGTGVTVSAPLTIAHAAGATAQGSRQRYLGIYTPPGYDPDRAQPYKTIYLQHGSGQDASDWLNIGDAPVLMDNLIEDGLTEPAVIVTTDQNYLGGSPYTILESTIIPFVQNNYNVSTDRMDRAFAGLSAGGSTTVNIINNNPLRFGYYGVFSWTPSINTSTANLNQAYILVGFGRWDTTVAPPSATTLNNLAASPNLHFQYESVAAGHDFNAWDQLLTKFMRDYLWKPPQTFVYTAPKTDQHITFGAISNATFGDPDFGISATASSSLPVSLSVTSGPCSLDSATSPANVHISGAGACTITASQAGNGSFNAAADVVRTLQVAKADQTISFDALADKTYGDADFAVSATASSGLDVSFGADGDCTVAGTTVHITGAGSCTIAALQTGDANWNLAPDVPQTFSIGKAALTVTGNDQTRRFGSANPPLTANLSGFVAGETLATSGVTGNASCTTPATQFSTGGTYPIDCSIGSLAAANYSFGPFAPGTLSVTYTSTITGNRSVPLVVSAGEVVRIGSGASVAAPVTVKPGGVLDVAGGSISGPVDSTGAGVLRFCGATVTGPLTLTGGSGLVLFGGHAATGPCAGNSVTGPTKIQNNTAGVEFNGNHVTGPVTITGNSGSLPPPDTGPVHASGNTISGRVKIQ